VTRSRANGYFHKDWQGTEIRPGCVVAYNLSGDVVKGEVTRCPGANNISFFEIRLAGPGPHSGNAADHLSKVKRPRSILVLEEPRENDWDLEEIVAKFGAEYGYDFVRNYFTDYPDYLGKEFSIERIEELIKRAKTFV
jgi:hypothetical protein